MEQKISGDGMSFLTSVSFHDAKLVDVRYDEKYGKSAFRFSSILRLRSVARRRNFYEISFSDGKFRQKPKRKNDSYILAFDCFPTEQNYEHPNRIGIFCGRRSALRCFRDRVFRRESY